MGIDSPAQSFASWLRCATVAAVAMATTAAAYAQAPPSSHRTPMARDNYGNQMAYGGGDCDAYCSDQGGGPYVPMDGGFTGPFPMGEGGTSPPIGYDLMNDVGVEGYQVDQRGPHYWDFRAEAVYMERDETFERDIDFTSLNVGQNIVLSSNQLEYDEEYGFRLMGRYDICPLSVLEFGYMGVYNFESSATAVDPNGNLFSLFSRPAPGQGDFGINPLGVNLAGGPLPFTERAIEQSISIESDLQTAEISYRRYWLGWSPRISGTLLAGFRYTKLNEEFQFNTIGTPNVDPVFDNPAFEYTVDADNDLAGFQTGAEMWVGLIQGLRLGVEGKGGIYNNHYSLANDYTTFNGDAVDDFLSEEESDNEVAFIGEASVDLVADVLPSWSLRVGYEVLFIDSVVLAGENVNEQSPFGNQGVFVPLDAEDGDVFYHGGHAGIEYIW